MDILLNFLRAHTIRRRMIGAIFMVIGLLCTVGGVGLVGMEKAREHSEMFMANPFAESEHLALVIQAMGNMRRYEKDLIINYEKADQEAKYAKLWKESYEVFDREAKSFLLGEEDADNPLVRELIAQMQGYRGSFEAFIPQITSGAYDSATAINRLIEPAKQKAHEAEATLTRLQKVLRDEAQANATDVADTESLALWLFAASLVLAVALVVPLTLMNSRSIVQPLEQARDLAQAIASGDLTGRVDTRGQDECRDLLVALASMQDALKGMVGDIRQTTESISTASTQIATGNQDLSGRTEQTAGSLQQTSSSMEQLTGTVRQTADSARTANQLAGSAADAAQRGGSVVAQVVLSMDEISSQSRKIAEIIGTIDGIAFQTNILALNAAVEAARAGEQGRGFAVVAGEVRNLAQRSATAAREIKSLIGASVEKVESGSRLVQDAGSTMNEIVNSVQRVSDIIGEITAAASEQSSELGQVNSAVTQLDQMTQQNAALVEQSAAAAESLREQAGRLSQLVATFRTDDSGHAYPGSALASSTHEPAKTVVPASSLPAIADRPATWKARTSAPGTSLAAKPKTSMASAGARPEPAVTRSAATGTALAARSDAATVQDDGDWTSF